MRIEDTDDLSFIWQVLIEEMKDSYPGTSQSFELWFGRMQLVSLDAKHAVFAIENETKRDIVTEKYTDFLSEMLGEVIGYEPEVTIVVDKSLAPIVPDDGTIISPLKIARERQRERERLAREGKTPEDGDAQSVSLDGSVNSSVTGGMTDEERFRFLREKALAAIESTTEAREGIRRLRAQVFSDAGDDEEDVEFAESSAMLEEEKKAEQLPSDTRGERRLAYNEDYTFENFIVGSSNTFAHAMALNVADNAGMTINPLFIWGPSGLGKTHLMYAIANRALHRKSDMKVIYVKGEEFMNQLIEAIQKNKNREFRQKYRSADMLLIDDIQFIAGKESTQTEFFHTFDALYEDRKQIIITSDRPPKELISLEERIRSRFEAGLLADIQPPDYELRLAILRRKIAQNNVKVPGDVMDFLAQNLQENIRQLEGVIKKLAMSNLLTGQPVNMEMVINTVPEYLRDVEPISDTVSRIVSCVARHYSVSEEEIMGALRKKNIKNARNVAMYVVRAVTNMSLPQIGMYFNRDHSTVHSNINVVETDLQSDPVLDATVNEIMKEIKHGG